MGHAAETWTWDFFIAHAAKDGAVAEELYSLLADQSQPFVDSRCLELGDDWDAKLATAQRESLVTVVLVSPNTEKAYYQREEIAAAIAMARAKAEAHRVVPVYLESGASREAPYGLRLKHGLLLSSTMSLADAARELLGLIARLKAGVARSGVPRSAAQAGNWADAGVLLQPGPAWVSPVQSNHWRYKVAAFDFDGTLLRGDGFEFSWEAVWKGLAFGPDIQRRLKRAYRRRKGSDPSRASRVQAYQAWCDGACVQFKSRGLTRDKLRSLCQPFRLTVNCRPALAALRAEGLVIAIISGGIHTFIEDAFPDYGDFVDFVFVNELVFSNAGTLEGVHATPFDFEGKSDALELVCRRVGCTTMESVFVGDHFNDESIMLKADRAIAYPPQDAAVKSVSHVSIAKDDLNAILPHILVE